MHWNQSLLDFSPGIALELGVHSSFLRQNRRIMGQGEGRETRHCLELQPGQELPSARIISIHIGLPTTSRVHWFLHVTHLFQHTIHYLITLPCNLPTSRFDADTIQRLARMLYNVTAFRLAFYSAEGLMEADFGGPYEFLVKGAISIS